MTPPLRTEPRLQAPTEARAPVPTAGGPPRLGVLLAILALLPPHTFWLVRVETELGVFGANMTDVSLFYTPVVALFLGALWSRWAAHRRPRLALRPAELASLYVALTLSAAFSGSDLLQNLTPVLVHPFWFASESNHWKSLIHHLIPAWFAPRDLEVLKGYYIGHSTFYTARHVQAWLTPLLTWGAFLLVIAMMTLCLSVLVRRQWTDRERLSYPVIQLPIELARPDGFARLAGNRLFQIGAGLTIALELMNCVHAFYPSVPSVNLGLINVGQMFVEPPWNALATWPPLWVGWLPFAVGISFFLPLDLSFSAWVFYLVRRAVGMNRPTSAAMVA